MISLGDLLVFVAVLAIVALFLRVAYTFVRTSEEESRPEAPRPQHRPDTRTKAAAGRKSETITASRSVSR